MDKNNTTSPLGIARTAVWLASLSALLAACSGYSLVDSVKVTATPTIYAPLGEIEESLVDIPDFDLTAAFDSIGTAAGGHAYKYRENASDTDMKVLMHLPIAEVPLAFDEYLTNLDFANQLTEAFAPQSFTVPSITIPSTSTALNLDLGGSLISTINSGLVATELQGLPEAGTSGPHNHELPIELQTEGYSTVTFSSGSLDIGIGMQDASADLVIAVSEARLLSNAVIVATDSVPKTLTQAAPNATIQFDLAGITLSNDLDIVIVVDVNGGTLGQTCDISLSPSFASSTIINAASGVSFTETFPIDPIVTPLGATTGFVGAVIGTGSILLEGDGLPAGWTGITRTLDLSINQPGGLSINESLNNPSTSTINLAGESINTADITMEGSLSIVATNATLTNLDADPPYNPDATISVDITNFTNVVLDMGDAFASVFSFSQPTDDIAEWVDEIRFSNIDITLVIQNGLPAGNNIDIDVQSSTFAINDTYSYTAGENSHSYAAATLTLDPQTTTAIDFTATVGLAGFDDTTGYLTLNNISPGAAYSFGGSVAFNAVWDEIDISPPDGTSETGTLPDDPAGLDLSVISEYLPAGINLEDIPVYLYMSGVPEGVNFDATMSYRYTSPTAGSGYLFGSAAAGIPLTPVANMPDFALDADTYYTGAIPADSIGAATRPDLSVILNARPSDLFIDYAVGVDTLTITPDMVDTLSEGASLRADLVFVIPLAFTSPTDTVLPIDDYVTIDEDLFGRTSFTGEEDIYEILNRLVGLTFTVSYENNTGLALEALVQAYPDGTGFVVEKDVSITQGTGSFEITLDEEDMVLIREGAFIPDITLTIPGSPDPYRLQSDASIRMTMAASVAIEIDEEFEL